MIVNRNTLNQIQLWLSNCDWLQNTTLVVLTPVNVVLKFDPKAAL